MMEYMVSVPTSAALLRSRITPSMETQLSFLMTQVPLPWTGVRVSLSSALLLIFIETYPLGVFRSPLSVLSVAHSLRCLPLFGVAQYVGCCMCRSNLECRRGTSSFSARITSSRAQLRVRRCCAISPVTSLPPLCPRPMCPWMCALDGPCSAGCSKWPRFAGENCSPLFLLSSLITPSSPSSSFPPRSCFSSLACSAQTVPSLFFSVFFSVVIFFSINLLPNLIAASAPFIGLVRCLFATESGWGPQP